MRKNGNRLLLGGLATTLGILGSNSQVVKADHLAANHLVTAKAKQKKVSTTKPVRLKPKVTLEAGGVASNELTDSSSEQLETQPNLTNNEENQNNSSENSSSQLESNPKIDSANDGSKDTIDNQLTKATTPPLTWESLVLQYDRNTATLTIPAGEVTNPTPIENIYYDNLNKIRPKKIIIQGPLKINGSACGLFGSLTELEEIIGIENLNTTNVNNMKRMFDGCQTLATLDVTNFNTEKVTDMSEMFKSCRSLTILNVSNFVTNNVTDMSSMFDLCQRLTHLDVSRFKTAKVKNMNHMFYGCNNVPVLDVSNFDTSSVESMICMFSLCYNVATIDVSNFDTSNVTGMQAMFTWCKSVTDLNVSNFHTEKVTSMMGMFACCLNLQNIDVSNFHTEKVTDMSQMFEYCPKLEKLNVSNFNTEKVIDMSYMFASCSGLKTLDISNFVMNITDPYKVDHMLSDLSSLDQLKLGKTNRMPNTGLNTPGIWVKVGTGTIELPEADKNHRWTSEKLMEKYNPETDYDTYVRYAALVIAHYQDENGIVLAPDVIIKGGINDAYTTEAKNIPGYTLTKVPDNANGNFADNTVTDVYYIYKKNSPDNPVTPGKTAEVIVHYQDESGNSLAPDIILSGKVGDGYTSSSKNFAGYTLKSMPINATGFFTTARQEVTYIYVQNGSTPEKHTPTTHTGKHRNPVKQTVKTPVPKKTTNNIPKDSDQRQKLPQTGSNERSRLLTATLGLVISALAVSAGRIIRKREKNKLNS